MHNFSDFRWFLDNTLTYRKAKNKNISEIRDIWRKSETFFRIFEKSELSLWILISYSVIFGDNRELSEEIWKISQNLSENWKMRKSEIISEKFWEIFPPGINPFCAQILNYFKKQLYFLFIKYLCGLHEYIKFFNSGLNNIESDGRDWHRRCFRRPFQKHYKEFCINFHLSPCSQLAAVQL